MSDVLVTSGVDETIVEGNGESVTDVYVRYFRC